MTNLVIQESGFSKREILSEGEKNNQEIEEEERKWIDFVSTHTQDEVYAYEHRYDYDPAPPVSELTQQRQKGLNELMLTALFNKFFTMTEDQKEMFFNDLSTKYWDAREKAGDPNWIIAHKRLEHPGKYYYSERKE